jgi:predicted acylesterase/phospholipase RssA
MDAAEITENPKGIWLALSGGGFRAALFHYGCFKRLRELGLLDSVYAISAVSGGALAAALLAQSRPFGPNDATSEQQGWEEFERKILTEAARGILGPIPMALLLRGLVLASYILLGTALFLFLFSTGDGWLRLIKIAAWLCFPAFALWICIVVWIRSAKNDGKKVMALARIDARYRSAAAVGQSTLLQDFGAAVKPAALRLFILHHRVFEQMPLGYLLGSPRVFLIAADLNTGREMVFSPKVIADLGAAGSTLLWNQLWGAVRAEGGISEATLDNFGDRIHFRVSYEAFDIPISIAVAASSAYQPFLHPVVVWSSGELVGSMVDGGVIDNHAMNVPYQMAKHINEERGPNVATTFSAQTSHVLAIDASASVRLWARPMVSRLWSFVRLPAILRSRQVQTALDNARDVAHLSGARSGAVGLRAGLPESCGFEDERIAGYAGRIRTHFDAFSKIECSTLAYLGYSWIEDWARRHMGDRYRNEVPLQSFATILPVQFAAGALTEETIVSHLRQSHHLLSSVRWTARRFAEFRQRISRVRSR